jgi:hypothetical protein
MQIVENQTKRIYPWQILAGRFIGLFQLVIVLAGCSAVPHERQQTAAIKSADSISANHDLTIEKAVALEPPEVVTWVQIPTQTNSIPATPAYHATVKVTSSAGQLASEKGASEGHNSFSIPLGAKLILLAVGFALLLLIFILAKRQFENTALGQGVALADGVLADRIRAMRVRLLHEQPADQVKTQAEIAELEAQRGRIKRPA